MNIPYEKDCEIVKLTNGQIVKLLRERIGQPVLKIINNKISFYPAFRIS